MAGKSRGWVSQPSNRTRQETRELARGGTKASFSSTRSTSRSRFRKLLVDLVVIWVEKPAENTRAKDTSRPFVQSAAPRDERRLRQSGDDSLATPVDRIVIEDQPILIQAGLDPALVEYNDVATGEHSEGLADVRRFDDDGLQPWVVEALEDISPPGLPEDSKIFQPPDARKEICTSHPRSRTMDVDDGLGEVRARDGREGYGRGPPSRGKRQGRVGCC